MVGLTQAAREHAARRNGGAPDADGVAFGAAAGPAKLTRKPFGERRSGAPAVVARRGRRFALTGHPDGAMLTLWVQTQLTRPDRILEEQHADPG